jgi:uncharacterized protein (TIGR03790 family)
LVTGAVAAAENRVAIFFNDQEPASRELAEFYAGQREIPAGRIYRLSARPVETVTRREFTETILAPVRSQLPAGVEYVVLIYGVPLRIEQDPNLADRAEAPPQFAQNNASVESELAAQLLDAKSPLTGALRNPWFQALPAPRPILVGRLDGPDPATVRRMVTDALRVERFGLHGRAYFDARNIQEEGYKAGDDWIRDAAEVLREVGFETELDEQPATWGEKDPVTDAAIYAGWYAHHVSGPFAREDFRFQPGALAYHIHSASGASVRTKTLYWVGPLLAKGAAATMGNVYEPYLALTPHVNVFFRRLLAGATFLEAAYASVPVLSWQTTFVGDPLYRPFSVPMDEQIARLTAAQEPALEWAYLRKVNMLRSIGREAEARELCRQQALALASPVLWEKLGDLSEADRRTESAIAAYRTALDQQLTDMAVVRVARKLARLYEAGGETAKAQEWHARVTAILEAREKK